MSELKRINGQLKRAFEGKAWHGPSVSEVLEGVTAEQAAAHPIAGAHSIWELTLHIATWERVGRRRIEEFIPIDVSDEEDWPAIEDKSDFGWTTTLEELSRNHEALRAAIRTLDETRLDDIVPGTEYTIYFLLHGVIQHDLYHAGQIALLKKALTA
ncbi:MAG TPA: DinB family protein [Blastocatellia bacterium]|nr:DinB family protein [Blastocatellia bacterium]